MEQLPKVAISADADARLEEIRKAVNEGFASGRVTKGQLVSWIVSHAHSSLSPRVIEKIRADHFDEITHLEAVVRQLKQAREANASLPVHELLTPVLQRQRAGAPGSMDRKREREKTDASE